MNALQQYDCRTHEVVARFGDDASGLRAIVAIHNTALGPSFGGCRYWRYPSSEAALEDALRLSRGMSYKNALAGLPFGGGKAVIIADGAGKSPALLRAFGRCVESLDGRYITAEDVGMTVADMRTVREETAYVSGLEGDGRIAGGDPSPHTAYGVFLGIEAAITHQLGRDTLRDTSIAVQGLGSVGYQLCQQLSAAGAHLAVADVDQCKVQRVCEEFGARSVPIEDILRQDVEVIAPCALGGVLNESSIPELRARIVAGAANNQLATPHDGTALHQRGILYAPDYVVNAGGIISVAREYLGDSTPEALRAEVTRIGPRLIEIFECSARESRPTAVIAEEMAQLVLWAADSDTAGTSPPRPAHA